jgi:hypothetical protein
MKDFSVYWLVWLNLAAPIAAIVLALCKPLDGGEVVFLIVTSWICGFVVRPALEK